MYELHAGYAAAAFGMTPLVVRQGQHPRCLAYIVDERQEELGRARPPCLPGHGIPFRWAWLAPILNAMIFRMSSPH